MTGLKTKCKAGRPDWEAVFQNIYDNSNHKVRIFLHIFQMIQLYYIGDSFLLWCSTSC